MAVSTAVLMLFLLGFLGNETLSKIVSDTIVPFQFIPSLLQFIHSPGVATGFFLSILLAASLIFGRFYCSFLCPLGTVQDICIRLFKVRQTRRAGQPSHPWIHYSLLLLTIAVTLFGSFALLALLDPFSLFGRIAAHPFKTLVIWLNNLIAALLEQVDIYDLTFKKQHHIPLSILMVSLGSFGILLGFVLASGRGYCNTLCPVGAILRCISRFSLFRFALDRQACRSCLKCQDVCKAGCIDIKAFKIDTGRCLTCFNCTDVCPDKALTYAPRWPALSPGPMPSRRGFILGTAAAGTTFLWAAFPLRLPAIESPVSGQRPILPPGAKSVSNFVQHCTACHLCISVCPTHVMTPAYVEYGLLGLMQPRLDYLRGHCDFDCNRCGQICPTGAITPLLLQEKRQTRIGTVSLNKIRCIVHVKKKHCGACGEACPTHAIFPVEKGRVLFPEINTEFCIGCGACEHACPTRPKAITITSESVHTQSKKYLPPALALPPVKKNSDGFPF